jgi:hypothetical protein
MYALALFALLSAAWIVRGALMARRKALVRVRR